MSKWKIHPFFSLYHWKGNFSWQKFAARGIGVFGLIWLLIEAVAFFLPEVEDYIVVQRPNPFTFVVVLSLACAIWHVRPRVVFRYGLKGRDLNIAIHLVDAFHTEGALVVPTNLYFVADINGRMLNAQSIQGALIRKHYAGKPCDLQRAIDAVLAEENTRIETISEKWSSGLTVTKYPLGTVVPIKKDGRQFYMLANTQLTPDGRASSTEDELLSSLRSLWKYLSTRATFGHIVVPVIGSQHGRMPMKREQIVQHILRTFVESCRDRTPCTSLTIAVYPPDVEQFDIDINFLDELVRLESKLAYYAGNES
ncbi:MAG: DUF6430 domain-containing protein [Chloroflexi bacterium]|nr:DUF6430 domain-containing protein [Chloroflexota bacterium]